MYKAIRELGTLLCAVAFALPLLVQAASPSAGNEEALGALHSKDWFVTTFRELEDDVMEAHAEGKRLAILFEQTGCAYCRKMHDVHLEDEYVTGFLKENFMFVQYNLFGDEEVVDLDGEVLTEKTAAEKWGLLFTPTIVFLPDADELVSMREAFAEENGEEKQPGLQELAVAALPGLPGKKTFKHMFMWVSEKGYSGNEHFQKFHARMLKQGL